MRVAHQLKTPLEVGFQQARSRRDRSYRVLRDAEQKVLELELALTKCFDRLEVAEAGYDQMHRHAGAALRSRNRGKALNKLERRREYGVAAREARQHVRRLERQLDSALEHLEVARANRASARLRYVVSRHLWLKSLSKEAMADALSYARLAEYVELANVPHPYREELHKIWHYTEVDAIGEVTTVHLFWGGERSPTGNGWSPDGDGHAHYILALRQGMLHVAYARDVAKRKRRMRRTARAIALPA